MTWTTPGSQWDFATGNQLADFVGGGQMLIDNGMMVWANDQSIVAIPLTTLVESVLPSEQDSK